MELNGSIGRGLKFLNQGERLTGQRVRRRFALVNRRPTPFHRLIAATALFACVLLSSAYAANDLILRIEGTGSSVAIPGESAITNHVGEIDVLSFSWGVARNGTATGSSVNAQQLTITKRLDKASPPLMLAVFQGTHYPRVKFFVRTQGASPLDYFVITMQDVVVMSCQPSGSADGTILESISLSMGSILFDYQPLNPDGTANGAKVTAGWNITTNQKI